VRLDVGVIIALASVLVAVVALWLETRRSRLAMNADMLLRLDERFCGAEMRQARCTAAQKLAARAAVNNELGDILDFFTNIAYMVKYGALDAGMAYEAFNYWVLRYWYVGQDYIGAIRQTDPESWLSLAYLVQRFEAIKRRRRLPAVIAPESLSAFLVEETLPRGAS
jgi:hypothetical protein